jgi:uncharacterized cupredoxin-like copper-binding protein
MPRWVKAFLIVALAVVLLLVILLLTGGGHGPGRHMSGGGDAVTSSGQHNAGGVGEPADAAQAVRTVEVTTLDTMAFEPSTISVSARETVTFVVANAGQIVHEFTVGNAAMQQEHAEAMDHMPAGMAHDTSNSITLQPGETKRLTWRLGHAATLEYACHQPDHYSAGMRGEITIT